MVVVDAAERSSAGSEDTRHNPVTRGTGDPNWDADRAVPLVTTRHLLCALCSFVALPQSLPSLPSAHF